MTKYSPAVYLLTSLTLVVVIFTGCNAAEPAQQEEGNDYPGPCAHPDPVLSIETDSDTFLLLEVGIASDPSTRELDELITQSKMIFEKRLAALGFSDFAVRTESACNRIAIEIPGARLTDDDVTILTSPDILEFGEPATKYDHVKWENELGKWTPCTALTGNGTMYLTSRYFLTDTYVEEYGPDEYFVGVEMNEAGHEVLSQVTGRLSETREKICLFLGNEPLRLPDGSIYAPLVVQEISKWIRIEMFDQEAAVRLSNLLNAGSLPVSFTILSGSNKK